MDIVQINHMFIDGGGREEHVFQISKYLSLLGHRVTIVTSDYTPTGEYKIKRKADKIPGIKIVTLKGYLTKIPPGRIQIPDLMDFLIDYKADIIHGHGMGEQPPEDGLVAAKIKNIPFVFTPHFAPYPIYEKLAADNIWKVLQEYQVYNMLRGSNTVIGVSPNEKDDIVKYTKYSGSNFKVIPNAFEKLPDNISQAQIDETYKKYQIPKNRNYIVFLGTLTNPRKGAFEAIQAFREARLKKKDLHLILVGVWDNRLSYGGTAKRTTRILEKLIKANHVTITGWISDKDKYALMSGADLFVSPTYYEAFGIALCEALNNKLPVIASNTGGCKYVVRNGIDGILVDDPTNIKNIAKQILYLSNNPDKAKAMGLSGYKRVNRLFSWEKTAKQLEDLYINLINKNRQYK